MRAHEVALTSIITLSALSGCTVGTLDHDAGPSGDVGPARDAGRGETDVYYPPPDPVMRTIIGEGVPADIETRFDRARVVDDATESAELVYPLDGAVMPRSLAPADLQWLRGAPGDVMRVVLENGTATITAYVAETGAHHHVLERADWRAVAEGDLGRPTSIRVDRLRTDDVLFLGAEVHVTFSRAFLGGAVYFWSISEARVLRADDATGERVDFMPTPPDVNGQRCVGCHTLSRSGRYMSGALSLRFGSVFDLTEDLSGDAPPTRFPVSTEGPFWEFSSMSPDDRRVIASTRQVSTPLALFDARSGEAIADPMLPARGMMPSWSPDGRTIAYVTAESDGGGIFGPPPPLHIATIDVGLDGHLGESRIIHRGDRTPGGPADSYPSWSPDSTTLAFAHGSGTASSTRATVYMMRADGEGLVELERASGEGDAFIPVFSPFDQDGYLWLAFLSRRDYGNEIVGTRGADRQQIWVTAVRTDAAPGEDPSSVPFWLPGQEVEDVNVWAYWAPQACRETGTVCGADGDCCSVACEPDAQVCMDTPPDRCRTLGQTCSTDADCCTGGVALSCQAHVCAETLY